MSEDVNVRVNVDTTGAETSIENVKAQADAVVQQWKIDRNTILRQVREGFTLISSLMSSFRQAMSLMGEQIDPFFSALVGMVLSTTSMLISSATVLIGTGIGVALGAVVLGLAISFNILTLAKLFTDKEKTDAFIANISQAIAAGSVTTARITPSGPTGGGF